MVRHYKKTTLNVDFATSVIIPKYLRKMSGYAAKNAKCDFTNNVLELKEGNNLFAAAVYRISFSFKVFTL